MPVLTDYELAPISVPLVYPHAPLASLRVGVLVDHLVESLGGVLHQRPECARRSWCKADALLLDKLLGILAGGVGFLVEWAGENGSGLGIRRGAAELVTPMPAFVRRMLPLSEC